jgi:tetratricopeptide (TPR) repeat protein
MQPRPPLVRQLRLLLKKRSQFARSWRADSNGKLNWGSGRRRPTRGGGLSLCHPGSTPVATTVVHFLAEPGENDTPTSDRSTISAVMPKGIDALEALSEEDRVILRNFVRCWRNHGGPVLFAGAGLSRNSVERNVGGNGANFPTWQTLADRFRKRLTDKVVGESSKMLQRDDFPSDPMRLADMYEATFGRACLLDEILDALPTTSRDPGHVHDLIAEIPWHAVLTTNYDDLVESAFRKALRPLHAVVTCEDLATRHPESRRLLLKLHGDMSSPSTIVITGEDYRLYETARPGLAVKARQLLLEHPVLFIGFSLNDPNFSNIDGWIRDTLGLLRLPALAVSHTSPLPADRKLWNRRGIHLLHLGPEPEALLSLFRAIRDEERRIVNEAELLEPKERVESKWRDIDQISKDLTSGWERRTLEIVLGLVREFRDEPGGRFVVKKLESFFQRVRLQEPLRRENKETANSSGSEEPTPFVGLLEVLTQQEQAELFTFCVCHGLNHVWIGSGIHIFLPEDLLSRLKGSLLPTQKAEALLARGSTFRSAAKLDDARKDLNSARELLPQLPRDHRLRGRIDLELRELNFLSGDAAEMRAGLGRPDPSVEVHSMCRRGADFLLLDDLDSARGWYLEAERKARSGDERYAALSGLYACDPDLEGRIETDRMMEQIPKESRPATEQTFELREQAAEAALAQDTQGAIRSLEQLIASARTLGWPDGVRAQSSRRLRGQSESAAMDIVGLLLADAGSTRDFQKLQQALSTTPFKVILTPNTPM